MITYLDRVCFGSAAPSVASELDLSQTTLVKWASIAFMITYAVFEVPAGWLGDRFGPRLALLRIVAWWSICTALTGLVGLQIGGVVLFGFGALLALRSLFGAGEAGAYPNITRSLHNWFPASQRSMTQGMVWMSGRIMGGLSPLVWAVLVSGTMFGPPLTTWRGAFVLFGVLGLLWCIAFSLRFRSRPEDHPQVNTAERELIGRRETNDGGSHAIPWRSLLGSRTLFALCIMYICTNFGWYFNATYIMVYMNERYELKDEDVRAAVYKGGPLWVGAVGCLAGGFLADRLSRRLGVRRGRRFLGIVAYSTTAVCWLGASWAPDEHWFFLFVSLGACCSDVMMGAIWATCQDIGRRHAGVTSACMNMIGGLGAVASMWLTGTLVERAVAHAPAADHHTATVAGYHDAILSYAAAYVLAAVCWLFVDPNRPIED